MTIGALLIPKIPLAALTGYFPQPSAALPKSSPSPYKSDGARSEEFGFQLNPRGGETNRRDLTNWRERLEESIAEVRRWPDTHNDVPTFREQTLTNLRQRIREIDCALSSPSGLTLLEDNELARAIAADNFGKAKSLVEGGQDPFREVQVLDHNGEGRLDGFEIAMRLPSNRVLKYLTERFACRLKERAADVTRREQERLAAGRIERLQDWDSKSTSYILHDAVASAIEILLEIMPSYYRDEAGGLVEDILARAISAQAGGKKTSEISFPSFSSKKDDYYNIFIADQSVERRLLITPPEKVAARLNEVVGALQLHMNLNDEEEALLKGPEAIERRRETILALTNLKNQVARLRE